MGIELPGSLKDTEAWSPNAILGPGWHICDIDSVEEGTSSGGHPQAMLQLVSPQGEIRDWIVIVEATLGKIRQLTDAAGIESDQAEFPSDKLVGKSVAVFVALEPDRNDPTKPPRSRVKAYDTPENAKNKVSTDLPADTSGMGGSGGNDDLPF